MKQIIIGVGGKKIECRRRRSRREIASGKIIEVEVQKKNSGCGWARVTRLLL